MYKKLIENLKQNQLIIIDGDEYRVQTKTFYTNINNCNLNYVKFVLTNHKILVVNPERKSIFLGKIVDDFYEEEYFPESFKWQGKTFKMFEKDIQIVTKIEFGNPRTCEGECVWVDYICEEDPSICVDMAYVYREKKRADILAKWIELENIKVIGEDEHASNYKS